MSECWWEWVLRSDSLSFVSLYFLPSTGETGIGKSTLMNTLFNTMFENEEASHYQNGVYLRPRTYDLQESNVHLKLTIVDTVGFGDQINKEDRWGWSKVNWWWLTLICMSQDPFDQNPDSIWLTSESFCFCLYVQDANKLFRQVIAVTCTQILFI